MQDNTLIWISAVVYTLGFIATIMLYGAIGSRPRVAPWKDIGDWPLCLISAFLWPALLAMLVIGGIGYITVGLLGIIVQSIMFVGYWLGRKYE